MKKILSLLLLLSLFNLKAVDVNVQPAPEVMSQDDITMKLVYGQPEDVVQNANPIVQAEPMETIGRQKSLGQEAQENNSTFSRVSNFSDPLRFVSIKVDPETAADEIDFWGRQMSEHALFAHLGLEDPDLKQKALDTHLAFEDFRNKFNQNPTDFEHMNTILPMLKELREFQITALKKLDDGQWIGWVFPLFLNHVTLELDYFVDKLNGITYSAIDEVTFWNRINSEHAAFAAHLLDPSERELFVKADKMSMKFNKIPKTEKEMMIRISLKASKQLDEFNKTARAKGKAVKSIIHPVLLDHVIREGERSIKTLSKLGLHKQARKFAKQYKGQILDYQNY